MDTQQAATVNVVHQKQCFEIEREFETGVASLFSPEKSEAKTAELRARDARSREAMEARVGTFVVLAQVVAAVKLRTARSRLYGQLR